MSDYTRAYYPGTESNCGFAGILQRLELGENITLAVYGGSATFGRYCETRTGKIHRECSWPSVLQTWFAKHRPHWRLNIINLGLRAYGSKNWANELKPDIADAYLLEIMLNDSPREYTLELLKLLKGPKLTLGFSYSCNSDLNYCEERCSMQSIIRIPSFGQRATVVEGGKDVFSDTFVCKRHWDQVERFKYLLPEHSLALYRDLLWEDRNRIRHADFSHLWNGYTHPDAVAQELAGHFATYALLRELYSPAKPCTIPALKQPLCTTPTYFFDAVENNTLPITTTGWRLMEDVPGKPGYVATEFGPSSNLTFLVNVTKSLQVFFLETYENIADGEMWLPGCDKPIKLKTLRANGVKVSITKTWRFSPQNLDFHMHYPCFQVSQSAPITFQAKRGKFKLSRLVAC